MDGLLVCLDGGDVAFVLVQFAVEGSLLDHGVGVGAFVNENAQELDEGFCDQFLRVLRDQLVHLVFWHGVHVLGLLETGVILNSVKKQIRHLISVIARTFLDRIELNKLAHFRREFHVSQLLGVALDEIQVRVETIAVEHVNRFLLKSTLLIEKVDKNLTESLIENPVCKNMENLRSFVQTHFR